MPLSSYSACGACLNVRHCYSWSKKNIREALTLQSELLKTDHYKSEQPTCPKRISRQEHSSPGWTTLCAQAAPARIVWLIGNGATRITTRYCCAYTVCRITDATSMGWRLVLAADMW